MLLLYVCYDYIYICVCFLNGNKEKELDSEPPTFLGVAANIKHRDTVTGTDEIEDNHHTGVSRQWHTARSLCAWHAPQTGINVSYALSCLLFMTETTHISEAVGGSL
jgi:hypothetical protein